MALYGTAGAKKVPPAGHGAEDQGQGSRIGSKATGGTVAEIGGEKYG